MTTTPSSAGLLAILGRWFSINILALGREMRLSYLPPLMVYAAAGISGLTSIVGTFYVKERLGLSAEFLAALGFWMMLPWALKMPLGHLVDLVWRWKSLLVYAGAGLITLSLLIMIGLLGYTDAMLDVASVETWYVTAALLAPIGYVLQDVVADAMTVEAVPRVDASGQKLSADKRKLMHVTMQTLGRVAIISGGILVSVANVFLLRDAGMLPEAEKAAVYLLVYELALIIPLVSILGVVFAAYLHRRDMKHFITQGHSHEEALALLGLHIDAPSVNWWILGGGLAFTILSLGIGLSRIAGGEEIIFLISMTIVLFLMWQLTGELDSDARDVLVGTALLIFVFRAIPSPGAGSTWWMIDDLGFDQQFLAILSLLGATLTLLGMFIFRRFMAERSIAYIIGFLTVVGTILSLPIVGMYFGLHEWTASLTGGIIDARFIALIDTALESPLGQIAMIPMLAWIANSAPEKLKATFFAVMASFTNLALSASQLGTKYINQFFIITREVKDPVTDQVTVPADYSQLGNLLITVTIIGFVLPLLSILFIRYTRFRNA
ncbi:BT1 family protein [Nitrosomonas cryotolerans]|uniref:BT1 family protein n=1 Tax=Nitrosomonas cryotolerans ATCC 49181 TaxID=1131553 RepID=A0A1N6GSY0_9PROT|nr:membrane protein [Nitrosomonas cryotolerans]SFP40418.1 BT1 family protein [Nitrosomonas cryotolerans]SIO10465.1 BT1 family protein [Nitrosomonas cryotolerans ATCC 49181]